jgi:predicted Fe-S protein YdhL (DUF1289 family)
MNITPEPIVSPCVRNCCLDGDDVCLGCFRTIAEITGWVQADAHTRRRFLDNAARRRQQRQETKQLASTAAKPCA